MMTEFAPAKINLSLHITGRRPDGYHNLDSLVAFADIGDVLEIKEAEETCLHITGPYGDGLCNGADNLVLRAIELFHDCPSLSVNLIKNLPVMSGIGGGSSDAAATLRAVSKMFDCPIPESHDLIKLGADVPVCMHKGIVRMTGLGDIIHPLVQAPEIYLVLVNPNKGVSTPKVFSNITRCDNSPIAFPDTLPKDADQWFSFIGGLRNDMTDAAILCLPEISNVLDALGNCNGAKVVRMSGSGATCFALFHDKDTAKIAEQNLSIMYPQWWVRSGKFI